jgi:SAM-dependent methyltransferase
MLPGLARLFRETAGVDGHLALLQEARQRSPSSLFVHGPTARLPFQDGQFDGVVCLDVLEHNEPRALLGEARRVLKHGGTLLLAVPACPWLWSQADEAAGHRCRYTLRSLRDELRAAGFSVVGHTHYQFILFPLVCFSRLFARHRTPVAERQPGRRLNSLLRAINQVEVTAFHRWALPWGSSLVVGARRAGMPAAA